MTQGASVGSTSRSIQRKGLGLAAKLFSAIGILVLVAGLVASLGYRSLQQTVDGFDEKAAFAERLWACPA